MTQPGFPVGEWLSARDDAQSHLHERAAAAARSTFGRNVFVRGVVEISNYCREDCVYCGMRRSNRDLHRLRANAESLAELLIHHRPAAMTDVNIQAGEDPVAVRAVALPLIRALKRETRLGISVCLGSLSPDLIDELREAGAAMYILKFEVADAARYQAVKAPSSLADRLEKVCYLARGGWHVSSGFIAGLPGQTMAELVENVALCRRLPLRGCSVSPFIPGDETPLGGTSPGSLEVTLNCMAALRLVRADWVIPAVSALNLASKPGGEGYRRGLRTGANLVTINLTPADLRADYVLYRRDRYIMTEQRILDALRAEGLTASPQSLIEYFDQAQTPASSTISARPDLEWTLRAAD